VNQALDHGRNAVKRNRIILGIVLMALFVPLWGCYESDFPLGPSAAGTIDPRLLGTWRCVQGEPGQNKLFLITAVRFDDKQYYIGVTMEGEKPIHYRAYSSSVKNTTLLNVQELKHKTEPPDQKWFFVRYTLLRQNILQVEIVKDKPFKNIDSSAEAIKKVVDRMVERPELYQDYCVCTKVVEKE
jgi:hypothetical protein